MRAIDLDLRELLAFEPKGGLLRFAGERALLFDAVALGLLRQELIETLGTTGARAVLTRFGYAHGWRTAEMLQSALPWDDENEWRWAGGRLHTLQGLVVVEAPPIEARTTPTPFAESTWHESYEAESLDEVERDHILTVLRSTEGNREEAAALLGIGTATLYRRLKRYRSESAEGTRHHS